MKKIFTIMLMSMISLAGISQINMGVSAGITSARWKGDAMTNLNELLEFTNGSLVTQPVSGFFAGGFVDVPLGDVLSIQPGIYYTQKGYKMRGELAGKNVGFLGAGASATVKSHYIDVPILLKAEVAKGLQVFAGPQFSYLVKNNLKLDAGLLGLSLFRTNMDITEQFNKVDLGISGGLAYTFNNGVFITAGYDHGLSRLDKNNLTQSYNRSFKAGVGIKF